MTYRRIIVGTDGSQTATRAVDRALALAVGSVVDKVCHHARTDLLVVHTHTKAA